jgi:DNA-binding transcriptional LysR family regulator
MELRHLRYFQAVGREEHFGRAAQRVHVAQPALTRQIKDLERELGVALFERLPRGVRLSSAGRVFLEDVDAILAQVDHAANRAKDYASGRLGAVRVGFSELAQGHHLIPKALLDFRLKEPNVNLDLVSMGSAPQIEAVKAGRLDVAFVYDVHHNLEDLDQLGMLEIGVSVIGLALYPGHRLAEKPDIRIEDLAGEPMIWPIREAQPGYYDSLMAACLAKGVSPRILQQAGTHNILLSLVSAGMGVGFITTPIDVYASDRIVVRPISDLDMSFGVHMLWRKADPSPALQRFIEAIAAERETPVGRRPTGVRRLRR